MSAAIACDLPSPLFWIPQQSPVSSAESSLPAYWYLGGKDITLWCKCVSMGLGDEKQAHLIERVNWVVEATLFCLDEIKKLVPKNPKMLQGITVKYKDQIHKFFLFQNTIFFNLPQTTSGSTKDAIPMVDLQTGNLFMRLRVRDTRFFHNFRQEIVIQNKLNHERILPILAALSYKPKYYYYPKPSHSLPKEFAGKISFIDKENRLSILTPAYKYNLHQLCSMMVFTEFFKLCISLEVAKALEYLHDQGYLHNDLKAGNVFLNEENIVVADYGLSKPIESPEKIAYIAKVTKLLSEKPSVISNTKENLTTPHIAAPELPTTFYTQASDIFAYGVLLLELCGKKSLFPHELYADKFYHSKITKSGYEHRLEELFGPRCPFDCIENIARDALSYRADDRPTITRIIERLGQLRSHFPESQRKVLPAELLDTQPLTSLYMWHTDSWKKHYSPLTHHFSHFNYSFSLWVHNALNLAVLSEVNKLKYLIKAKRIFEELGPNRTMYKRIQDESKRAGATICYISIFTKKMEFLGRILVVNSRALYPSPVLLRNRHFTIRDTLDIETGKLTNLVMMTAKTPSGIKTIELRSQLPLNIRYHPCLVPAVGTISYQSQKGIKTSLAPTPSPERTKTTLFYHRCAYSYKEALSFPALLSPVNLWNWALNLSHLLFLLHNQNLLLGKLQLSELGVNEKDHLVIKHLNGLTRKSEILEWQASGSAFPEPYLSIFGNPMSEEDDVRNLGLLLFIFEEQRRHPKPVDAKENYESVADRIFAISDQFELDCYLDRTLSPHNFGLEQEEFSSILRGMLSIDPTHRFSSKEAHKRLLALGRHQKYAAI